MIDVAAYQRDGYLRVPVFGPGVVADLAHEVNRLTAMACHDAWEGEWVKDFAPQQRHTLLTLHGVHQKSEAWYAASDALKEQAAAILGGPVAVRESTLVVKPPETGQPFPVHQDACYYGLGTNSVLAVVHLDTTTPENGPLRFLAGHHIHGLLEHKREGGGKAHMDRAKYPIEATTEVCADAGDVVFFSLYTPHASYPNRSDKPRRTVRLWYAAA